ncbi:MAG: hypothetical protein Q9195_002965 [Heterodermia aff. obscurata]
MKLHPKNYILTSLFASLTTALSSAPLTQPRPPLTIFTFGDSYSSTGFSPFGPPPSAQNPLGNPAYPGQTTIGTADYPSLLPITLNHTSIRLYNLACSGSTIDDRILSPTPLQQQAPSGAVVPYCEQIGALSLRKQVEDIFLPHYRHANPTLTTLWFGINDVLRIEAHVRQGGGAGSYIDALVTSYLESIAKLGKKQRFLVFNVPPLDRRPPSSPSSSSSSDRRLLASIIARLNARLAALPLQVVDTYKLFSDVLDNPAAYGIKNTTGACKEYALSREEELWVEGCGVRRSEYFWADGLHVTSTVQRVLAGEVGRVIGGMIGGGGEEGGSIVGGRDDGSD